MKQRRIVILGFMGSCPIAGVSGSTYITSLVCSGSDTRCTTIEDSARYLYDPISLDTSEDCTYALGILRDLADV